MPDYTIEVRDGGEADYSFDVTNVQAVIESRPGSVQWLENPDREPDEEPIWIDPAPSYDEWHLTKVPVYQPPDPESFWSDIAGDRRQVVVKDAAGEIVGDGVPQGTKTVGIKDTEFDDLFFLAFSDVVDSLPDEQISTDEEPPYPTPWGFWEDGSYYF